MTGFMSNSSSLGKLEACRQCGKCCMQGGPALHSQDLIKITRGFLPVHTLITVRKGEVASHPMHEDPILTGTELIKIKGKGKDWECFFYNKNESNCSMYENRPFACQVLQCWDPTKLLEIIEKDTLSRFDIIAQDHAVYQTLLEYEQEIPVPDLSPLLNSEQPSSVKYHEHLVGLVNRDLSFRDKIIRRLNLSVDVELFYFGRPVFQLLQGVGVGIKQTFNGQLDLVFPS